MAEKIAEKIRELAELLDEEHIARALGLPVEVVRGVLSGEVPDEALDDFDPKRPPDVRLVERKKFVRTKIIGVASTGGCGATTLTAVLAVLSAKKSGLPVAAVDLNEFAGLGSALGLDTAGEQAAFYPGISWWGGGDAGDSVVRHPALENLSLVLGAATTERWLELKFETLPVLLDKLAGAHAAVWVDCPVSPALCEMLLSSLDVSIFVLRCDTASVGSFWRALSLIRKHGAEEKTAVVLNFEGASGGLSVSECRRALRKFTDVPVIAVIPEDLEAREAARDGRCLALDSPRAPFVLGAEEALNVLWPETSPAKKKRGLLAGLFGR
ncbi:MAG: ParA family protein [Bacillota bacterium]|nr:ParA family protein [Bacillota bacterium]